MSDETKDENVSHSDSTLVSHSHIVDRTSDRDTRLHQRTVEIDADSVLDGSKLPFVLVREDERINVPLAEVKRALIARELMAPGPRAITEQVTHTTAQSFCAHYARMAGKSSVIWETEKPRFVAIYDYPRPGAPSWCAHRSYYEPQRTKEWRLWAHMREYTHDDLIELLEQYAVDLVQPPQDAPASVAKPEDLLTSIHNFRLDTGGSYSRRTNPTTGFIDLHVTQGSERQTTKFHSGFYVAVIVFEGCDPINALVSMAIRIEEGKPIFKLGIRNADRMEEVVLDEVRDQIAQATGAMIFAGAEPETVKAVSELRFAGRL